MNFNGSVKQLNPSVPISPKGTFYFSDGTGRDSYIYQNNGGLCAKNENKTQFSLGTFPKIVNYHEPSPVIHSKAVYYQSDGTGRDSYVTISSGGLHSNTVYGKFKSTFYTGLRNYAKSPHSFKRCAMSMSPRKDAFAATSYLYRNKYPDQMKLMSTYQCKMSERLALPKFIMQ